MKKLFSILFLLSLYLSGFSQWQEYLIGVRGDTLNRIDIEGNKQGPWVISIPELRGNEGYDEQGFYENDKKEGRWVRFSLMGDKIAEENYRFGVLDGVSRYYTRTGGLLREESWKAIEPGKDADTINVYDLTDPTLIVNRVVVKSEGKSYRHGAWVYYEPIWGTIVKKENYFADQLQKSNETFPDKEDGADIRPLEVSGGKSSAKNTAQGKDITNNKEVPKPQAVLDFEKKSSGKKKAKVRDGNTGM